MLGMFTCHYTLITVTGKKSAVHACLFFLLLAIHNFSPFTSCSTHHRSVIHKGKPVTLCSNSGPDPTAATPPRSQICSRLLSSVPDGQLGSTDRPLSSTRAYKGTSERGHNGAPSPWELRRMWRGAEKWHEPDEVCSDAAGWHGVQAAHVAVEKLQKKLVDAC